MSEPIPLVDLAYQHAAIAGEVEKGFLSVIERSAYILGEEVERFEQAYAAYEGAAACVGVASGTDALELILRAQGVGPGDEVIVPANTFAATALAAVRAGARVIFADVDPDSLLLTAELTAPHVTERTRAIMAVHLYGQFAPLDELDRLSVPLIQDAAQSHGAAHDGTRAGATGHPAAVSFYPGKNLGAYGDAGAVITADTDLAERVRALRNYGAADKYIHDSIGFNARMDTLQAVVLAAKLAHLEDWNAERRAAAARYDELLAGITRPATLPGNEHVYHLYVVRVPERDRVLEVLRADGIGAGVHYPLPLHRQPAFATPATPEGSLPNAEAAAREVLSLPLFPGITTEQQERVADALRRALP